jgi:hypothetical protein
MKQNKKYKEIIKATIKQYTKKIFNSLKATNCLMFLKSL